MPADAFVLTVHRRIDKCCSEDVLGIVTLAHAGAHARHLSLRVRTFVDFLVEKVKRL